MPRHPRHLGAYLLYPRSDSLPLNVVEQLGDKPDEVFVVNDCASDIQEVTNILAIGSRLESQTLLRLRVDDNERILANETRRVVNELTVP
jgi:hypothetical protein